jgi:hypothetical protein
MPTVRPVSRFTRALLILDRRADVPQGLELRRGDRKSELPFRVDAVTKRGACMHHPSRAVKLAIALV